MRFLETKSMNDWISFPVIALGYHWKTADFDIFIASAQYAALKTGAEMGKLSMDKSKQEKQAGDVVNKMFAVLIGMSVPLQIYFNVPGKTSGFRF